MPKMSTDMYYAHSANHIGDWHPLTVHLGSVANLAKDFASESAWRDEAHLAGLLHDLGKYADRFQRRLHGQASGFEADAHIRGEAGKALHSTAGAMWTIERFGISDCVPAYHIGLLVNLGRICFSRSHPGPRHHKDRQGGVPTRLVLTVEKSKLE